MIATALSAARLAIAITSAWPDVPIDRAQRSAIAITVVATDRWPAVLIAAIAYHETAMRPWKVGALGECGFGQVAHYESRKARCAAARDYNESARQLVGALDQALAQCHGRKVCALNVYAAGNKGAKWRSYGDGAREFLQLQREIER